LNTGQAHWHILGAGAIGSLFADALSTDGRQVSLILRDGVHGKTRTQAVERGDLVSEKHFKTTGPRGHTGISHLLVTTKAYDVCSAIDTVIHRLNPDCNIVLLSNGMGFQEQVLASLPSLNIYCGTTTEGAHLLAAGHVRHAGSGETRIGRAAKTADDRRPLWFHQWERAIDNSVWDSDIQSALWTKLAINCVINPLTALNRCHNGELEARKSLANQVTPLRDEVAAVCRAQGHVKIAAALPRITAAVIQATSGNRSSMLQDMDAGRLTEIDYITGYLLEVADQHSIDIPLNRALFEAIKSRAH